MGAGSNEGAVDGISLLDAIAGLGVPLDKEAEFSVGPLHCLGDAVFTSGDNFQIFAEVFDGLVMVGVDVGLFGVEDFCKGAFRVNCYVMIAAVFNGCGDL